MAKKQKPTGEQPATQAATPAPDAATESSAPTAQPPEDYDELAAEAAAEMFLIGNLMAAAKRRFTELALPWRDLKEAEQERLLRGLAEDVRLAVGQAVRAIASHERLSFRAEVESVQFKGASDIKATLKLAGGAHSHALADAAGGFVTVVIENVDALLDIREGDTAGDADQGTLFDASTSGTGLDTKPEAVPA